MHITCYTKPLNNPTPLPYVLHVFLPLTPHLQIVIISSPSLDWLQTLQLHNEVSHSLNLASFSSTQSDGTVECLKLFPLGGRFHYHCFTRLPLGKTVMQPASNVGFWPYTELYICQPSSGFFLLHFQATYVCIHESLALWFNLHQLYSYLSVLPTLANN